jgi:hypothetical protein
MGQVRALLVLVLVLQMPAVVVLVVLADIVQLSAEAVLVYLANQILITMALLHKQVLQHLLQVRVQLQLTADLEELTETLTLVVRSVEEVTETQVQVPAVPYA